MISQTYLDIKIEIGKHCCNAVGMFFYKHYTDGTESGRIELYSMICNFCDGHVLDAYDYIHVLEHEYIELLCARINFLDGGGKWNARGFNKAIPFGIPNQVARCIHGKDICEVNYT
jgi:hypothetical protein